MSCCGTGGGVVCSAALWLALAISEHGSNHIVKIDFDDNERRLPNRIHDMNSLNRMSSFRAEEASQLAVRMALLVKARASFIASVGRSKTLNGGLMRASMKPRRVARFFVDNSQQGKAVKLFKYKV